MNSVNRAIISCLRNHMQRNLTSHGLPTRTVISRFHSRGRMMSGVIDNPATLWTWMAEGNGSTFPMPASLLAIVAAAASCMAVGVSSDVQSFDFFSNTGFHQLFPTGEVTVLAKNEHKKLQDKEGAAPAVVIAPLPSGLNDPSPKTTNAHSFIQQKLVPLENEVANQIEFKGLNASQFFETFFGNEAPFREFQKERGDIDIVYGKWADKGSASAHQPDRGSALFDNMQERTLTFKTLANSYFCPKYASAQQLQRVMKYSDRLVVLESRTQIKGIPFGDRFQIVERWIIETRKYSQEVASLLTASFEVRILKTFPFEGQLRKRSAGTVHETFTSWCDMAKDKLERTTGTQYNVPSNPDLLVNSEQDEEFTLQNNQQEP